MIKYLNDMILQTRYVCFENIIITDEPNCAAG